VQLTLGKQRGGDQGFGSRSAVIDGDDYALP
jgi:hypothetical protein